MRSASWISLLLAFYLALAIPTLAIAQYTDCVQEEAPTAYSSEQLQEGGLVAYPDSLGVTPFTDIFTLFIDQDILDAWGSAGVVEFMNGVIDSTGGGSFLPLWNYFCIGDADTSWDGISIYEGETYATDHLFIRLLNEDERGQAYFTGLDLAIHQTFAPDSAQYIFEPLEVAQGRGFAHELGHVMHSINTDGTAGGWEGECNATGAEIVSGHPPNVTLYQTNHDVSFRETTMPPTGGGAVHYRRFLYWQAYLHGHYSGDPEDETDDFLYGLVRSTYTGTIPVTNYATFSNIGTYFENVSGVPGATGAERLGLAFQRSALALHANEADTTSLYGFGGVADAAASALFTWWEPATLHSRVIPPTFPVGADELTPVTTPDYVDPVDEGNKTLSCATKPLGWRTWGTDYLAFTADPSFFSSRGDTLLKVRFESTGPLPEGAHVRVGYIGYDSAQTPLQDQGIVTIEESISTIEVEDGVVVAELLVPDFGNTIKAVVVVSSLVQDPIPGDIPGCGDQSVYCWETAGCSAPDVPYDLTYGYGGDQLFVPGAGLQTIQQAIDVARPGQEVRVTETFSGYTESLTLRPGIPVLRALGSDPPVIRAATGASFAVTIPDTSDAATVLKGFVIEGGTSAVLRLEGPGTVSACTIRSGAQGSPVGVRGVAASGAISDCLVAISASADTARGIDLSGSSVAITNCEVRTSNASGPAYGIVSMNGSPTIQYSLVVGGNTAIWSGDTTLVAYCTVDSTLGDGIWCGPESVVRNTIAVPWFNGESNPPDVWGIRGGSVSYCIAPFGIQSVNPHTPIDCVTEDPLFCDLDARTLRIDSYGNPANNPSGELIGAFPVACFGGTLARNVTTDALGLEFLGNIAIPAGITLNLLSGTALRFANDAELHVAGTLNAVGTESVITFNKLDAGWQGIVVDTTGGAVLNLESCSIRGAETGVRQMGWSAPRT